MNDDTLISVHCYAGDAERVGTALPLYLHHERPVVVLSPTDSKVKIPGVECQFGGKAAYIGQDSLDRQLRHLQILLKHPYEFFLMHDSDSFCLSPKIPDFLYAGAEGVVWSNEIVEPRPHESPYPKIAMQPGYFLNRLSLEKLVEVMPRIRAHEITPYVDWFMLAATCEAGLSHRPFDVVGTPDESWENRLARVRSGAVMMHPIKTLEQITELVAVRKQYES